MTILSFDETQILIFDLDGTLIEGLGPYESSLEKAIKETFDRKVEVNLTSFHGLTDREILYRTLEQTSLAMPGRNQNQEFETKMGLCLSRFGEIYEADPNETKEIKGARGSLIDITGPSLMGVEGRMARSMILTGNTELMARKKMALITEENREDEKELEYQGINNYFHEGSFGNQSYFRENLMALCIQQIEGERANRDGIDFVLDYNHEYVEAYQDKLLGLKRKTLLQRLFMKDDEFYIDQQPVLDYNKQSEFQRPLRDVYVIGDTKHNISSGVKSRDLYTGNIFTVGVLSGRGSKEELEEAGANYVIDDVTKLMDIVPNKVKAYSSYEYFNRS